MTFGHDPFFINKCKYTDAGHLGDNVVIWVDSTAQILPETSEITFGNFAVVEVELFIERSGSKLLFTDIFIGLFLMLCLRLTLFFAAENSLPPGKFLFWWNHSGFDLFFCDFIFVIQSCIVAIVLFF
jgi:hypothetical protein